jgi:hypothetical protein
MMKGYILADFMNAVIEKEHLAEGNATDKWEVVPYELKGISGKMLNASAENFPAPVTVEPKLTGWHRIYVCMLDYGGRFFGNHTYLKLTDDEYSSHMRAADMGRYIAWSLQEKAEEAFWKAADMTGQSVTIEKRRDGTEHTANILYLRFEPMSEDEIEQYKAQCRNKQAKTMLAHMDGDFFLCERWDEPKDYLAALSVYRDADVGIVSQEIMNDLVNWDAVDPEQAAVRRGWDHTRAHYMKRFQKMKDEIYPLEIEYAHRHGMKLFAAQRMALSNFCFPLAQQIFDLEFVRENQHLRCEQRDGTKAEFLSYAYQEVQDFMLASIKKAVQYGFDGVELLFSRGVMLMFEQPVQDRFDAKYGKGIDVHRLPMSDARLTGVWCDIMGEFIARVRGVLDEAAKAQGRERIELYITAAHAIADSKTIGLDVEALAKAGLIDGVVQSNMSMWEMTDDVLDADGLVDIEAYCRKAETEYVIKRQFGSDMPRLLAGLAEYRRIADESGIRLFTELQWENSRPAEQFVKAAKSVYEAGGQSIALWDCYPSRVQVKSEWSAVSRLGDREYVRQMSEEGSAYHTVYKVLSFDGRDMRFYHPSWRG